MNPQAAISCKIVSDELKTLKKAKTNVRRAITLLKTVHFDLADCRKVLLRHINNTDPTIRAEVFVQLNIINDIYAHAFKKELFPIETVFPKPTVRPQTEGDEQQCISP